MTAGKTTNIQSLLCDECLPALNQSAAYFSMADVRAWLQQRGVACPPPVLRDYLSQFMRSRLIRDAGPGWYSRIASPCVLNAKPVARLARQVEQAFPLLDFACWSTEQVCSFGHLLLARFVAFIHTERDAMASVAARYERVREGGVIVSRAILLALGIDWEGRRQVLAVEYANRESRGSWREFLLQLKARGLNGVQFVVSDDHPGLKAAIREVLPEVWWQRCYVHFLRNALDYLPRKADDDCLQELRWMYERRNVDEARRDLKQWLEKWGGKYPKLCAWVETNIEETWTFYRLPVTHHKHMKSTNLLERFNQEIKRRTLVVRIFPDEASCLRLVRAVAAEQHEEWMEGSRYLHAALLLEQIKPMKQTMAISA